MEEEAEETEETVGLDGVLITPLVEAESAVATDAAVTVADVSLIVLVEMVVVGKLAICVEVVDGLVSFKPEPSLWRLRMMLSMEEIEALMSRARRTGSVPTWADREEEDADDDDEEEVEEEKGEDWLVVITPVLATAASVSDAMRSSDDVDVDIVVGTGGIGESTSE